MTYNEAVHYLKNYPCICPCGTSPKDCRDSLCKFRVAVKMLEEKKEGKWIEKTDCRGDCYYDCSNCGESWTTIEGTPWNNGMNFCPVCGAKMDKEVQTNGK